MNDDSNIAKRVKARLRGLTRVQPDFGGFGQTYAYCVECGEKTYYVYACKDCWRQIASTWDANLYPVRYWTKP